MSMTVKQFVEAVHKAWEDHPFLSGTKIAAIKYSRSYNMENFSVKCEDKTSFTVIITEDEKIFFF